MDMKAMVTAAVVLVWIFGQSAPAHEGKAENLKELPQDHQVRAVTYCQGTYTVELTGGSSFQYREFNLRFKTDSSEKGPASGSPVIIPSGMSGDRAFLIFAVPADISAFIKDKC